MKKIINIAIALVFGSQIAYAQDVMLITGPDLSNNELAYSTVDASADLNNSHLSYHLDGTLESKGSYYKGQKNGLWMSWSEDGAPLNQAYYTNGQKDGAWKVWDENGTLRYEMYYKHGKRVKTWKVFDENGALLEEKTY